MIRSYERRIERRELQLGYMNRLSWTFLTYYETNSITQTF